MKLNILSCSFLVLTTLLAVKSYAIQQEKELSNKYECQIEFGKGKANVSNADIDRCLIKIPKDETIHFVQIISSADSAGGYAINKKLTDERLKKTQSYLLKNIKNAEVKSLSIGRNDALGKKVYILILASKPYNMINKSADSLQENKNRILTPKTNQTALNDNENFNILFKNLIQSNENESEQNPYKYDKRKY